tara:strand:- start:3937 stop:4686 length:750 start_codon:yes stop_codon:yes gene_type:complete
MKRKVFKRRALLQKKILAWHRNLGLSCSILLVIILITGIPLNHVEYFGLDRKFIKNNFIQTWYGMEPTSEGVSYKVGDKWLTYLDGSLYLNGSELDTPSISFIGAIFFNDSIIVASKYSLMIYTLDGTLVENIFDIGTPNPIVRIGRSEDNRVVIQKENSDKLATADFFKWSNYDLRVTSNKPGQLPNEIREEFLNSVRGKGLPWSRLLLDLHSGRFFGNWGPYIFDIVAISLLVLVFTGFYNWYKTRR